MGVQTKNAATQHPKAKGGIYHATEREAKQSLKKSLGIAAHCRQPKPKASQPHSNVWICVPFKDMHTQQAQGFTLR